MYKSNTSYILKAKKESVSKYLRLSRPSQRHLTHPRMSIQSNLSPSSSSTQVNSSCLVLLISLFLFNYPSPLTHLNSFLFLPFLSLVPFHTLIIPKSLSVSFLLFFLFFSPFPYSFHEFFSYPFIFLSCLYPSTYWYFFSHTFSSLSSPSLISFFLLFFLFIPFSFFSPLPFLFFSHSATNFCQKMWTMEEQED